MGWSWQVHWLTHGIALLCCPSDVQLAPLKGARAAIKELLLFLLLFPSLFVVSGRLSGSVPCLCVRVCGMRVRVCVFVCLLVCLLFFAP